MTNLFYPETAGFAKDSDTSLEAAIAIENTTAPTLRLMVLDKLKEGNYTADEIAEFLSQSILSIRPRVTELNKQGKIQDSGIRRLNYSGKKAVVWELLEESLAKSTQKEEENGI